MIAAEQRAVGEQLALNDAEVEHLATLLKQGFGPSPALRAALAHLRHLAAQVAQTTGAEHLINRRSDVRMQKSIIRTDQAPQAIGTYSQAVRVGDTVFFSGQIPLVPETMELIDGDIEAQIRRVFDNLRAVARAAGGDLGDIVKLTIFLTDLGHFARVNQVMGEYFQEPYPARAAVGVAALPKGAAVEMDAIMVCAG